MNSLWYTEILGYGLVFAAGGAGLFHWRLRTQRSLPPVEFKLLRGPGEMTLRTIRQIDAGLPLTLLCCVLGPLLGGIGLFAAVAALEGTIRIVAAIGACLVFLAALFLCGRLVVLRLNVRRDFELRYLGERAVAEELEPLLARGFRLFHNVAIIGGGDQLNLDHVLVGPTGITLLTTETRRRHEKKDGPRQHEVVFDGKQLVWPWGSDRDCVADVEAQAVCLSRWLAQSTGLKLPVHPTLVLPGWWVDATAGHSAVDVVNHKQVLNAINARGETTLLPPQIEQVCHLLEAHCRDVTA